MTFFSLPIPSSVDLPLAVANTLGKLPQLSACGDDWACLLRALGLREGLSGYRVTDVRPSSMAKLIVDHAVAVQASPGLRPATYVIGVSGIRFKTADGGDIGVSVTASDCTLHVNLEKHADAQRVLILMLTTLYEYRVPRSLNLLAEAVLAAVSHQ